MSLLNRWTTSKDVANSVLKFGVILFTPIRLTAVVCYTSGPLKVRLSFRSQNVPPPPPRTLHKNTILGRHLWVGIFSSWLIRFWHCLLNHLLWSLLCVEISTLAYEANSSCWPEKLSVVYCTHIIQTKLMLKNRRYPQNSMFTATEGSTDMALVVLG